MITIWKYNLALADLQAIQMPKGAEILHVEHQAGSLCLWARVHTDEPQVSREIYITGTGHPAPPRLPHVCSFLQGAFVWHVFDGGEK